MRSKQVFATAVGLAAAVAVSGCESGLDKAAPPPPSSTSSQQAPVVPPGQVAITFTFASAGATNDTLIRELSIIKARIASQKLSGTTAAVSVDGGGIVIQGPVAAKSQLEMLGRPGVLGFRPVLASGAPGSTDGAPPEGVSADLWRQYAALDCKSAPPASVQATAQIVACQNDGSQKYVLDATAVNGTSVTSASASANQYGSWQVNASLTSDGAAQFGQLTTRLAGTGGQVAITVDGVVYSAPAIQQPITGGALEITGKFDQATAKTLAAILQNGALPAALNVSSVTG